MTAPAKSPAEHTPGNLTGVVEKIAYTSNGAGNQWTTIDGVKYATWWNVHTMDWSRGDTVTFEAYERPLWHGQPSVLCAQRIRKALTAVGSS